MTRIIIHVAEGGWASTYTWFRNAAAEASANYVVSSTGRVAQMVPDRDIAWHAGNWAYNESSVGIEHAGFTNVTHFPDVQYRGSAKLAAWIADTYLITPDRQHVIGHYQVPDPDHPGEWGGADHHTDPGRTWNWPLYMAYLRADAHDTYQQVVDNADTTGVSYDPAVWHVQVAQTGRYGRNYLAAAPGRSNSPVKFRLAVPATDHYDLLMRWPCGADSARVGVSVLAIRGLRSTTVDEARGCGRFQYVGTYNLAAGNAWRLQVSSASRAHGTIVADAFKLVEQSDPTPPTAPVVTARAGETGIALQWTKGKDNIAVGGYHVLVDSALRYLGTARTPGGHRPCLQQRARHLGARARHGLEPVAEPADLDSHRRLPAVTAGIGRDAAAAIGRAAVVGARGRARLRGVRERPPHPHDRRDGHPPCPGSPARPPRRSRWRAWTPPAACPPRPTSSRRHPPADLGARRQPVRWRVIRPRSSGDRARLS